MDYPKDRIPRNMTQDQVAEYWANRGGRVCKACNTTNPDRGFYSWKDRTCKQCRDDQRAKRRLQEAPKGHNITRAEVNAILAKQNGLCAICDIPLVTSKNMALDHDHTCCPGQGGCYKCIRGYLCRYCNSMLGFARDNPSTLAAGIAYLENSPLKKEAN